MVNWLRSLIMGVSLGVLLAGNVAAEQLLVFSDKFPGKDYISEAKKLKIVNELNVIISFYGIKGDIELVKVNRSREYDLRGYIYKFYTGEVQEDGSFKRNGPLEIVNLPWYEAPGGKVTELEYADDDSEFEGEAEIGAKVEEVTEVKPMVETSEPQDSLARKLTELYDMYPTANVIYSKEDDNFTIQMSITEDNLTTGLNYDSARNEYDVLLADTSLDNYITLNFPPLEENSSATYPINIVHSENMTLFNSDQLSNLLGGLYSQFSPFFQAHLLDPSK